MIRHEVRPELYIPRHERPCNADNLVCQRDSNKLEGFLLQQGSRPVRQWGLGLATLYPLERGMCSSTRSLRKRLLLILEGWPVLERPTTDGIVRNVDTTLGKQILDIAKTDREPVIQPNGMLDNLGWKAIAGAQLWLLPAR